MAGERDTLPKVLATFKEKRIRPGRKTRAILRAWAACPNNHRLQRSAVRRMQIQVARAELKQSIFAVPPATVGDLELGRGAAGPISVDLGARQAHLLQASISGGGKSNNNRLWLDRVAEKAQSTIIPDLVKREYRPLVKRYEKVGKRLFICNGRQICAGVVKSPHPKIPPLNWGVIFSDMLTLSLGLPPASSNLFRVSIHERQEANGILNGSEKNPTLYEITDDVRASSANAALKAAILNRLDALLTELGPSVLGDRDGFSIPHLCNRSVIFELDGLSYFAQNFLIAYLLGAIFAYRIHCPEERKGMMVFCLDEASRIFSQHAESTSSEGPSYFSTMASQVRGADLKLFASVQSLNGLGHSIVANSSIKIMGPLGDYLDWERMGRCMDMNPAQIEHCRKRLRPGVYAARVGGEFNEPFIIKNDFLDLPDDISDEEAWKSGEDLRRELMSGVPASSTAGGSSAPLDPEAVLSADERAYLAAVRNNPYLPSTEYARLTGFSNRKAAAVRKSLIRKGFLREWPVETSVRGNRTIFLEPLAGPGRAETHPGRKGDFRHQLGVHLAAKRHESQYELQFEKGFPVGNSEDYLDIYGIHRKSRATVGVEVETDAGRGFDNLRRALEIGLDKVVIVACTRAVRDAIETLAKEKYSPQELASVSFLTLSDYWPAH
jgi:hypothetical protein